MGAAKTNPGRWFPHEMTILRERVAKGGTRKEITHDVARTLNRTAKAVDTCMYKEGLTGSHDRRVPLGWSPRLRPYDAAVPLDLGPGDGRYVAACLAQGGFHYTTRLPDGRLVTVRP